MRLAGARAVVTGGSSGIGAAVSVALGARGVDVLLVGRDETRLAEWSKAVGGRCQVADLADPLAVAALGDALVEQSPDVVVHNAGIGLFAPAHDTGPGQVDELVQVNLLAPVQLTRAVLPGMLARGSGHLVFVGSIAGALGVAGESAYAASKAALGAYAASLRVELAGSGIGVTTVIPGAVDTAFFTRRGAAYVRQFPAPVSAERVAARLVHAIERGRSEVVVPRWLRIAVTTKAAAPEIYARLASRFG